MNNKYIESSAPVFFGIAIISIINTLLRFFGSEMVLFFGLGITQFIDVLALNEIVQINKILLIIASLSISLSFLLINFLVKKGMMIFFIIGSIIYLLDILVFIYYREGFQVLAHLVVLKLLYDSYNGKNWINK